MSWDLSRISGPFQAPLYGDPVIDPDSGAVTAPLIGYASGLVFIVPLTEVTDNMEGYVEPVPDGVPLLAGDPCTALVFPDQNTAQTVLASFWIT